VAATLGAGLVIAARDEARRLGAEAVAIHLAEHPAELPLIGAARTNHSATHAAVVLDFGHTAIKRGIAYYEQGALARLEVLSALAAPIDREGAPATVAEAIHVTLHEAPKADRDIVASVASYVNPDGTLAESHSRYALLRPDARLKLGHDGTLAACGIQASDERAAVIMLGTALGVGFVPPRETSRSFKPEFEVRVLRTT
jgi:hypothetical protein